MDLTGKTYCLTGTFATGSRREVARILMAFDCWVTKEMSVEVDYLVVGKNTLSFTPEMERALQLLRDGFRITVIVEDQWLDSLVPSLDSWQQAHRAAATIRVETVKPCQEAANVHWESHHPMRAFLARL